MAFYRGREGVAVPRTALTLARDQGFTLLLGRLPRIQRLLRPIYRGDRAVLAKIDGEFWKRLDRLSRPRRKRLADTETDKGSSGTDKGKTEG